MSGLIAIAKPYRIKASHRRRWKCTSALRVYQHTDALGSPVAVTNSSGAVIERMAYEPFGKVIGTAPKDGPGYTGHVLDAATGMNYAQQRYYDPMIGRFLSVDPVSANANTGAMFNRYNYAANNPYLYTDPDGRVPRGSLNLCSNGCSMFDGGGGGGGRAEAEELKDKMPQVVTDAIESAGKRIKATEDPEQIAEWNKTKWTWDPKNQVFVNDPKIGAFVNQKIPNTIFVGARFAEFADTSQKFTYHQASFRGGGTGITFITLHEFGHVWTAGRGTPGTPERERLANMHAFRWLPRVNRSEVKCRGCIE